MSWVSSLCIFLGVRTHSWLLKGLFCVISLFSMEDLGEAIRRSSTYSSSFQIQCPHKQTSMTSLGDKQSQILGQTLRFGQGNRTPPIQFDNWSLPCLTSMVESRCFLSSWWRNSHSTVNLLSILLFDPLSKLPIMSPWLASQYAKLTTNTWIFKSLTDKTTNSTCKVNLRGLRKTYPVVFGPANYSVADEDRVEICIHDWIGQLPKRSTHLRVNLLWNQQKRASLETRHEIDWHGDYQTMFPRVNQIDFGGVKPEWRNAWSLGMTLYSPDFQHVLQLQQTLYDPL